MCKGFSTGCSPDDAMKRPDSLQFREAWLLFFILGVVMINFPFLVIFSKPLSIFGFPLLFLYFFVGWPLSIVVIYAFCRWLAHRDDGPDEQP